MQVNQGTLSLNGGGSSNGYGLAGGAGGTLQFGLPNSGTPSTFTVTGGEYAVGNTTVNGGTLDLSAASAGIFFVNSLRLAGAGTLLLGAQNATAQNGFVQGPTTWAGATGIPFLSGSGTLTVFGGGSLINGVAERRGPDAADRHQPARRIRPGWRPHRGERRLDDLVVGQHRARRGRRGGGDPVRHDQQRARRDVLRHRGRPDRQRRRRARAN